MDLADCSILMYMTNKFLQKQTHTLKYFGTCFNTSVQFVLLIFINFVVAASLFWFWVQFKSAVVGEVLYFI